MVTPFYVTKTQSDDDEPVVSTLKKAAASTPKKTSSRKPSGFPKVRSRRPATNEAEDDDDQLEPVTKRERHDSLDSEEETPKKRPAPAPAAENKFKQLVAIDFGMWGCGK